MFESVKGYLAVAAVVVTLGLLATVGYLYKDNKKEAGKTAVAVEVNKGNEVVADQKKKSDDISDDIDKKNQADTKQSDNKTAGIIEDTRAKVAQVKEKAKQTPAATPEAKATQDKQSEAQKDAIEINAAWDAYCAGQPNDAQCKPGVST